MRCRSCDGLSAGRAPSSSSTSSSSSSAEYYYVALCLRQTYANTLTHACTHTVYAKVKLTRGHPFVRVRAAWVKRSTRGDEGGEGGDSHAEGAMVVAELSRHPRRRSRCFSASANARPLIVFNDDVCRRAVFATHGRSAWERRREEKFMVKS